MDDNQTLNVVSSGSIKLIQLPPENIPLYWVQETELIMVAQGGDALAQQLSIAFGGVAAGAVPGAFAAISQFNTTGKIGLTYLIALILSIAGVAVSFACACIQRRQRRYPQKLLEGILARKLQSPVV